MRVSFCHLISLALLISSVFVSAGPAPDNNGGGGGDSCSTCWVQERNKLPECQNIPKSEIDEFAKLADQQIIDKKADFPHLIPCLCALVPKVPSIIDKCNCNKDDANGLTKESTIVNALCKDVNPPKPSSTNTGNTSTGKGGNNKSGYGSGDDSTPGDASGDGSGNDNATDTSTNDSSPVPATNAAVSVQWAGSFVVTLGAVVVGLTL